MQQAGLHFKVEGIVFLLCWMTEFFRAKPFSEAGSNLSNSAAVMADAGYGSYRKHNIKPDLT